MVVKNTPIDVAITDEAAKFAAEHRITAYVEEAMKAATDVFADARSVAASLKRDPQYGHLFVDIHVTLNNAESPEDAAKKDADCVARWAPHVPPALGELIHHSSSWTS